MDHVFYTLQDFIIHTENITYWLMLFSLLGIVSFWRFLTGRDEASTTEQSHSAEE